MGTYDYTVYSSIDEAEREWRALERSGLALPYQTFDWVSTWASTLRRATRIDPCPVVVKERDGTPLLLLPLGTYLGTWRGRPRRYLTWLAGDLADQWAPVLGAGAGRLDETESLAMWRGVLSAIPNVDLIALRHQPPAVYGRPNPLRYLGLPQTDAAHATSLIPDWEVYLRSKASQSRRADSRRQRRRLEERGEVSFQVVTGERSSSVIDTMIKQKRRRFMDTGRGDMFAEDAYADFYHRFAEEHPEAAHLSALMVGDDIVATDWGVIRNRTFHGLMTAFEGGDWHRFSPGRLLTEWVIEWCCGHDIDTFDFSTGGEAYKHDWCEETLPLCGGVIPHSIRGHLSVGMGQVKRKVLLSRPTRGAADGPPQQPR